MLLQHCEAALPLRCSCLELGSGTGWFGIQFLLARPDVERLMLTEMREHGAFDRLQNAVREHSARCSCAPLDWRAPAPQLGQFDLVLGSDLGACTQQKTREDRTPRASAAAQRTCVRMA